MTTAVAEYVEAIVRRNREPMEPKGFQPDWNDKPRRHKVYPDLTGLPLPTGESPAGGRFSLGVLGDLLRDSYGLHRRRLAVHANADLSLLPTSRSAVWSRGTASGGGLYPAEIYWVSGGSGPALPGVYYYSTPHHTMQRLLAGDGTGQVRRALGGDHPNQRHDQFLLVSIKFWKNAFKYNSFCYHAVTMDVGTLLGTWQMWTRARGIELRPALWFDEPALNELLGVPGHAESVFAVVPLPWAHRAAVPAPAPPEDRNGSPLGKLPSVTAHEVEKSQRVIRFAQVERVHAATVHTSPDRPEPAQLAAAGVTDPVPASSGSVRLPGPSPLDIDVTRALRARRSSFGRFSEQPGLTPRQLGTVLAAGAAGALASDLKEPDGTRR